MKKNTFLWNGISNKKTLDAVISNWYSKEKQMNLYFH